MDEQLEEFLDEWKKELQKKDSRSKSSTTKEEYVHEPFAKYIKVSTDEDHTLIDYESNEQLVLNSTTTTTTTTTAATTAAVIGGPSLFILPSTDTSTTSNDSTGIHSTHRPTNVPTLPSSTPLLDKLIADLVSTFLGYGNPVSLLFFQNVFFTYNNLYRMK